MAHQKRHWRDAVRAVKRHVGPWLLKGHWAKTRPEGASPSWGCCYAACEAVMHLSDERLHPYQTYVGATSHWFLRTGSSQIIDPTVDQFDAVPVEEYECARGRGFLTSEPSRLAQALIDLIDTEWRSTETPT